MKTNISRLLLLAVLLFAANACRQDAANGDDTAVNKADNLVAGEESAAPTETPIKRKTTNSELAGGAPVPAKRENLTAADRAAILRAVGFTDYAERSPRFVEWWNESYGTPLKNAGVTFYNLDGGRYLAAIMVDQGANQSTSVYALYQETGADKATAKLLELDTYDRENGKVNKTSEREKVGAPEFDEQSKILTITAAARGIGGCGERVKYKFVGDRAETIEARYQKCSNAFPPPEEWELIPISSKNQPKETLPLAKSGGISVCAEGYGGNGLEIKDADFVHIQPAHAVVLKRWLCFQKTNMRPVRADENSASSQKYFREDHPNLNPFYAVGDFNNNGIEDFAVILTYFVPNISPLTKRPLNAMAVFEMSPAASGNSPKAAYFSDRIDSLFIIAGREKGSLGIASYPSDDGFMLVPKGKTYTAKAMVDF